MLFANLSFVVNSLIIETNATISDQFTSPPPSTEWSKTYGGTGNDGAFSVIQTKDDGYALAGFTNSFGAASDNFWLIKLDSTGSMQWNETYGGIGKDDAYSVIQTSDGGYAIVGFTNSSGAGNYDAFLVKTDANGNTQWNKTYGGTTADDAYSVVQTDDGGYAIAGYTTSFGAGGADFWLVKVDSVGNVQWNQTYGGPGVDDAASLIKTNEGGYAIIGWTRPSGASNTDCWLVKVDSSGGMQWNRTYGGISNENAHSIIQTNDGGYAIAGYTSSIGAGNTDCWLVKLDSAGGMQWNRTYGGISFDFASSLMKTSEGGYIIAGYTNSFGAGDNDVWLVKVDSNGNMEWNQTYGGPNDDYAYSVIQASDGGYAVAGYSSLGSSSFNDAWLVKTTRESLGPTIGILSREPAGTVQPTQSVKISTTITDALSQIKNATLSYSVNDGTTWQEPVLMSFITSTNLYEGLIPSQSAGTMVYFRVVAINLDGSVAIRYGAAPYTVSQVISEYPLLTVMLIFIFAATIAATAFRKIRASFFLTFQASLDRHQ